MIETDEQLRDTQSALSELERSMATLNRKKGEIYPARFELMAEPILDHIRKLRAEIDAYLGMPVGYLYCCYPRFLSFAPICRLN